MSKPKKGKKLTRAFGDITLDDFASSTVCKSRPKKSSRNVTRVINELEEDKLWDEKGEEFDVEFVETVDEEGSVKYVLQNTDGKKRKSKNTIKGYAYEGGNDYPMDIWFLISEYIRPEDVGRFASICKTSFAVTNTAKFWFCLYKRYYRSVPNLPERLQPECMLRFYGLRCSVVRALYHMYPPFVERWKSTMAFEKHPDCLNKRLCILMWFRKQNSFWYYYFKLRENNILSLPHNSNINKPDLLEMLEDVSANSEENCRILEVTCKHFLPVPTIQGLTLNSVIMTLSSTFRHHKLQMVFGSGKKYNNNEMVFYLLCDIFPLVILHFRDLSRAHAPNTHKPHPFLQGTIKMIMEPNTPDRIDTDTLFAESNTNIYNIRSRSGFYSILRILCPLLAK